MKCFLFLLLSTGAVMAQVADTVPGVAPQDSIGLVNSTREYYDFYYSQGQADQFVAVSDASYTQADQVKKYRFRDKTFTQRVARGFALPGGFDDYVWIGAGLLTEIRPNGKW